MMEARRFADFTLPWWVCADARQAGDGAAMICVMPAPHEVMVHHDRNEEPARAWLAVCLCERDTAPHGTLEDAVADGLRHLRAHGVAWPQVAVGDD